MTIFRAHPSKFRPTAGRKTILLREGLHSDERRPSVVVPSCYAILIAIISTGAMRPVAMFSKRFPIFSDVVSPMRMWRPSGGGPLAAAILARTAAKKSSANSRRFLSDREFETRTCQAIAIVLEAWRQRLSRPWSPTGPDRSVHLRQCA